MPSPWVTAILLASGEGRRFGDLLPKQFHSLSGKKLYLYALETFLKVQEINDILIVAHAAWIDTIVQDLLQFPQHSIRILAGGLTRQHSSYLGLQACLPCTSHVVIHDAVRPFVSESIIRENIRLAIEHGASDTCIPSHDTIVHSRDSHSIDHIPPRLEYLRGQTPQSFHYPLILKAHEEALAKGINHATDDCQLILQLKHPIKIALGSDENIKVTTQLDLLIAEQLLRLKLTKLPAYTVTSLKGKIFAVTGATGGIGQEITKLLEREGATIIPLSRTSTYPVDLTSETAVQDVFTHIFQKYGPIDGLINAVGYLKVEALNTLSKTEIEKLIHTNFTSIVYTCKYCQIKPGGHILNLASTSYTRGRALYAIYSGMKAAVVNFTQGLALEYPELQVNSILPPRTDTPMRKLNFPQDDPSLLLSPQVVAQDVIKALHSKNLTGMVIEVTKSYS